MLSLFKHKIIYSFTSMFTAYFNHFTLVVQHEGRHISNIPIDLLL